MKTGINSYMFYRTKKTYGFVPNPQILLEMDSKNHDPKTSVDNL